MYIHFGLTIQFLVQKLIKCEVVCCYADIKPTGLRHNGFVRWMMKQSVKLNIVWMVDKAVIIVCAIEGGNKCHWPNGWHRDTTRTSYLMNITLSQSIVLSVKRYGLLMEIIYYQGVNKSAGLYRLSHIHFRTQFCHSCLAKVYTYYEVSFTNLLTCYQSICNQDGISMSLFAQIQVFGAYIAALGYARLSITSNFRWI